jgi:hypothetical protein
MNRGKLWTWVLVLGLGAARTLQAGEVTHRLYDGLTAFVHNDAGKDFSVQLTVRDINLMETGPREVLFKVYDPEGRAVVRQVIPDDGVVSKGSQQPAGAWDHEGWYYAYCRMQGIQPMLRWSAPSSPDRLAVVPGRTFRQEIKGGKRGVYRVMVVGVPDHYVTLAISPDLPFALAGHPHWLHGHGDQLRRCFLYVPRGTIGIHFLLTEFDVPHTRHYTLTGPDGKKWYDGTATGGFHKASFDFDKAGQYDDQVFSFEAGPGTDDFLVDIKFRRAKDAEVRLRGEPAVSAVFAPDADTARAIKGGALYHDERVFWQPVQIRLHDWLKSLKPEEFIVKDSSGKVLELDPRTRNFEALAKHPGYLTVNGPYWAPPTCDYLMHHYQAHKNRAALNVALRDLAAGLRSIGPNDHPDVAVGGPFANMGYEFSNYAWHYWRPAWRILQHSEAPADVKAIVREAFLLCGDRLAFCITWARTNGNAFAQVVAALRYCQEATADPLHRQLFETYFQRFVSGGWGERVGVGPSGPVQESFGYAYHYASYILTTWQAINADLKDERFQKVHDRIRTWFSYTLADERIPAGPWSSRTHHYPHWNIETEGPFAWKGLPGPDFTVSVNDASEWFAARRRNYYVLTYHGRLTPKWNSNAHAGTIGYGGGMLCQLQVPGKGPVLAATLNGSYGEGMHPSEWRNFHIHSLVGRMADGRPLVGADSEHLDTKLTGNLVSGSGEVRESSVLVSRSYTFAEDGIACEVRARETEQEELLGLWVKSPLRGKVDEAYEMIPFVPNRSGRSASKKPEDRTSVIAQEENGQSHPLTQEPFLTRTITIDRGGFGVRIELLEPRKVKLGEANTILIQLIEARAPASKIELRYRLLPFVTR